MENVKKMIAGRGSGINGELLFLRDREGGLN